MTHLTSYAGYRQPVTMMNFQLAWRQGQENFLMTEFPPGGSFRELYLVLQYTPHVLSEEYTGE